MKSRIQPDDNPGLFDDLPLRSDPDAPAVPAARAMPAALPGSGEPLSLFDDNPETLPTPTAKKSDSSVAEITHPTWRAPIPAKAQISASLLDLAALLAVGLLVWLGLVTLGVQLDLTRLGYLALFFLPFSFLYQVFPLAFWGRTPGMARVGLVARGRDGRALTFAQAGLRWAASLLTVLTLGLPLVATQITGRSLADRLSDSRTLPAR